MSSTTDPNVTTKQTFTAAMKVTDKQKQLQECTLEAEKVIDPVAGCPVMTTNFGVRVGNDDSTLKAGNRGPTLVEDFHFREKMNRFDHERIPERVVHARGSAAHGFFQVYDESMKEFTSAPVLTDPSRVTSTFVRFSTVLGSRGSADTVRDVRGFATRFYTNEGNWDLVGNAIPVFFVQDALKFVDLIHAGKPEPHNEIPQAQTAHDNFWDFISLTPEASHMIMWVLSDRAIPRSYRMMQGFGVNTFTLVNEQQQRTFVKFHWRPVLGVHSLTWDECLKLNGLDPDYHRRDLWEAIDNGAFPEYEFGVQLIPERDENKFDFDLLDCTKLVPEELVPVRWIGKMVLNKNVSEFFTETEQVAYCTQHVVPGIDFSNDPMLQGRNFSYLDTQLSRLGGPNFMQIPINRPICPVINNNRDGWNQRIIHAGKINYWPNRTQVPKPGNAIRSEEDAASTQSDEEKERAAIRAHSFTSYHEKMSGMKTRLRGPKFQEHVSQAQLFFNSMSPVEKQHIIKAACFELGRVDDLEVRTRVIALLNNINHDMAVTVSQAIGVRAPSAPAAEPHDKTSPALSQLNTAFMSIKSRKIAILLADGYEQAQVAALVTAIKAQAAIPMVVSTRKGTIYSANHSRMTASGGNAPNQFDSKLSEEEAMDFSAIDAPWSIFISKSVLFDATILVGGQQSVDALAECGETTAWLMQTFKHQKAMLAIGPAIQLLRQANLDRLSGIQLASERDGNKAITSHGVVTVWNWSATASGGEAEKQESKLGTMMQAISTAVTATVGAATGARTSEYMPNDASSQFFDAMKLHRSWGRDVTKVPAA